MTDNSLSFKALKTQLLSFLTHHDWSNDRGILRFEFPLSKTPPLSWLQAQKFSKKVYWHGRDEAEQTAGLGSASQFFSSRGENVHQDFELAVDLLNRGQAWRVEASKAMVPIEFKARYYGGLRFPGNTAPDSEWEAFGSYSINLPLFELITDNEKSVFAVNLVLDGSKTYADVINTIKTEAKNLITEIKAEPYVVQPKVESFTRFPSFDQWSTVFERLKREFQEGQIQKVVLSRKCEARLSSEIDPVSWLEQLKRNQQSVHSFLFQPEEGQSFFGHSPESLFKRDVRQITSEAIAGTRRRGRDVVEDTQLEQDLRQSKKDLLEQQLVSVMIRGCFEKYGDWFKSGDVSVLKLKNVQHLQQKFEGRLKPGVSDLDFLVSMHPTPAVCGLPLALAEDRIAAYEPFQRGWYSGVVFAMGKNQAQFVVAIRSALAHKNKIQVFSGAGIVPGSDPKQEWDELDDKISPFIKALNLEHDTVTA